MIYNTNMIVFPEGDTQEIGHTLSINEMVDINGNPLQIPLATVRVIAYRVCRISTQTTRNEEIRLHHLELLDVTELSEYVDS